MISLDECEYYNTPSASYRIGTELDTGNVYVTKKYWNMIEESESNIQNVVKSETTALYYGVYDEIKVIKKDTIREKYIQYFLEKDYSYTREETMNKFIEFYRNQ